MESTTKRVGKFWETGLIWKNDNNHDWKIQASEMAILEHADSSESENPETLRYYEVKWPSSMTPEAQAASDFTLDDNDELYEDGTFNFFKTTVDYVDYTVLAKHVKGVTFHKSDSYATTRPTIEYKVKVEEKFGMQTELGTVSLRSPATIPASKR